MLRAILVSFYILLFIPIALSAELSVEERCNKLYEAVRCPACGGQSIKDSNAQIAVTLREHIKRDVLSNKSDEEIILNLKTSYGEQIINSTTFNFLTLPLWLIPIITAAVLFKLFRVRSFFDSKTS